MKDILDNIVLILFVLFLIFMVNGFMKQSQERHRDRERKKDNSSKDE